MIENVAAELSLDRLMDLLGSACERESLDFKEALDLANRRDLIELAKDVLAMANSGGGYIVVGVEDGTRRRLGMSVKASEALRDAKTVNDQLKRYCGGYIRVLIAQHELKDPEGPPIRLALFRVRAAPYKVPAQDDGSCPDPSNPRKLKWTFRRGDVYVRKGDESVKVETPEDLQQCPRSDLHVETARQAVQAYIARFAESLNRALPPLPPNETANEMCGESLITRLMEPKDFLLLGPSGSGKSLHLKHLCLAALKQNELPVLVPASRYKGGDLSALIDNVVAPFSPEDCKTLLIAPAVCGFRPLLVIDGLNECQAHLDELVGGLQALRLRYSSRLVLASQEEAPAIADFDCDRLFIALLTPTQKRSVYCYHAGIAPTNGVDHLCQSFANCYDLTVAGRCHDRTNANFARVELYDRYCRGSLPEQGATVLTALLRDIAGQMGHEITNLWTRDAFERHAEDFLSAQGTSLALLDQLRSCRLVRVTDDSFSFEHDLLLHYFRAEEMRRDLPVASTLALELTKPKNQSLFTFLLPRHTEPSALRALFAAASKPELLREVLLGRCGEFSRRALMEDCKQFLADAAGDLPQVTVNFTHDVPESGNLSLFSLTFGGRRDWTPYEMLLCDAIAISLDNQELREGFLQLLDLTQWTLRAKTQEAASRSGIAFSSLWQIVVGQLACASHSEELPCLRIASSLRDSLMRAYRAGKFCLQDELLARVNRNASDHFSLAMLLECLPHSQSDYLNHDLYINLATVAWESRIYHLRFGALMLLRSIRHYLYERHPEKVQPIRDLLGRFETRNWVLSSTLVETLACYEAIEPLVSADQAIAEIESVIAEPVTGPELQTGSDRPARAYSLLSRIFEEVFQGAYYDAYESLEPAAKTALLCLAAQKEPAGFTTNWILTELLNYGGESAGPVFQQFAATVDPASSCPQYAAAAYALGIFGCARFMNEPPAYTGPETPAHKAWQTIGRILFWLFRQSKEPELAKTRIEQLWEQLPADAALAVPYALYNLQTGISMAYYEPTEIETSASAEPFDVVMRCPTEAKALLEHCLKNRALLGSVFRWGGIRDETAERFVIQKLGRIGDEDTILLLREVSDDPKWGVEAIAAIKKIRESPPSPHAIT